MRIRLRLRFNRCLGPIGSHRVMRPQEYCIPTRPESTISKYLISFMYLFTRDCCIILCPLQGRPASIPRAHFRHLVPGRCGGIDVINKLLNMLQCCKLLNPFSNLFGNVFGL